MLKGFLMVMSWGTEEGAGSDRVGGPHGGDCRATVVVVVGGVEGFVR